ncbi:MAG: hypothetical protein C5B53_11515 [Candidatus Melainabacteria bacterium]|nr:MAG: hypothetical protein C5B53_11515 [Candidatus Melainabacteria bacterium]
MNTSGMIRRRTFLAGLAGLSTAMFLPFERAEAQVSKPFSFAFVSDCHLITRLADSFKLTQESQLFLQDAIKQINGLAPDFVIFGGDQVEAVGEDEANWQLFIDIVQTLNCPWSFILGEKDVSGNVPVDKLKTYGRDWKGKGLAGDQSYWSQDVLPGVHLIGLDTSRANTMAGELSSEQLTWLQADLDSNKHGIVIVASHHPLLAPAPFDGGPPWDDYVLSEAASAREILNSSRYVRLAVSGHVYVSKIERERDIWYVSGPALDVYPCGFRFFHVDQQGITVETYQVDYPALVKKARNNLVSSTLALHYNNNHPAAFLEVVEGARLDQNAQLPFSRNGTIEPVKHRSPVKEKPVVEEKPPEKKKEGHSFFKRKKKQEEPPAKEDAKKVKGDQNKKPPPPAKEPTKSDEQTDEKAGQEKNEVKEAPDAKQSGESSNQE